MKNVILLLFTVLMLTMIGCQDVTVGYLLTEDASYNPDTLVVKTELDDEPGEEDYYRSKWGGSLGEYPDRGGGRNNCNLRVNKKYNLNFG